MEKGSYRILYNFLLPFVIIIAFLLRINFLSFVYFIFALFLPLTVSPPTSQFPGHPHRFIICITLWSILCLIGQLLFNFIPWNSLLSHPLFPYDQQKIISKFHHQNFTFDPTFSAEIDCHPFSRWLRQIGLDKIQGHWGLPRTLNLFASDLLVLCCGTLLLFRLKVLQRRRRFEAILKESGSEGKRNSGNQQKFTQVAEYLRIREWSKRFEGCHNAILVIGCCIVGAFHPSLLSLPYFLMFIAFSTLWAFDRPLSRKFWFTCRRGLLIFCAFHLCLLYIYQLPNVYRFFPPHGFVARILGLVHYQSFPCEQTTYPLPILTWIWPEYLAPIVTFFFYYLLATQISIVKEKEEFSEVDSLFSKAGGAIAALVMKANDGSRIALGYQVKDMGSRKESTLSQKVPPPPDTPISSKKTSVTSLPSSTSKKSAKISLHFAEKLAAMKLERERMKNLAKWENLKPILETIKSQSYVLALIILMAWSLCYHSWSTFVMLILSFIIWMHPNSQKFYHQIATFIVGYAEILLIFQFAFSLPFTQEELPDEKPAFLRQLGLEKPRKNAPVFDILLKSLFNLAFWYALKQKFVKQKIPKEGTKEALEKPKILVSSDQEKLSVSFTDEQPKKRPLIERIKGHVSNFWIFLLLILLLWISLYDPVVFYRIGYMMFFLVFLTFFVCSFPMWRKMLHQFWIIMIGYCILVITLIYTYQFHGIPELYSDYLGMSDAVAKSLGLERISSSELLFRLLTPISFLIVSLIQLNFFHEKMMKSTQKWEDDVYGLKLRFLMAKLKIFHRQMNYLESGLLEDDERTDEEKEEAVIKGLAPRQRMKKVIGEIERKCKQMLSYRQSIWNLLWRFAEIHIEKVIAGLIVYTAMREISVLNLPLIICVTLMLPFQSRIPAISDYVCFAASGVILLKMLFQMEFIREDDIQVTCYNTNYGNENGTAFNNYGSWFRLRKVPSIFDYTKEHIFIILCLVFRELIKIRQFLHRKRNRLEEPPQGIMFPGIDRCHADEDAFHCLLYLSNYFFYKFGVEITFIASAISIGIRNDLFAVFYVLWLLYMLTRTRMEMSRLWIRYTGFHVVCFAFQYLLCVGMPNFLCINYFWDSWDTNLIEWLCLPSFKVVPIPSKLFADFIVLLCITSQYYIFKLEDKYGPEYPGGDNQTLSSRTTTGRRFIFNFDLRQFRCKSSIPIPISKVPDYISDGTTLLDKFKHVFFMYFYWITLSIIFIAGTTRITLFAAGYVFGCFLFLWMGNSLFFKPIVVCLQMWDNLIYYNVCVILLKTILQIVGCVYMGEMCTHFCWLLQLFGIACNKSGYSPIELIDPEVLIQCDIPLNEAGIFYDNLCFVFLLIQRRIFGSEYFKHVIAELKAQRFFASRGAELIEKINKQEIEEAEHREKEMMEMVDKMVNKISKKQEKTKQKDKDPEGIFSDTSSMHDLETPEHPHPPNTVIVKDTIMVEVQGYCPTGSPSTMGTLSPTTLSPMAEEAETLSMGSLDVSNLQVHRQLSADSLRAPQQLSFDEHHRRKSANPDFRQRSEEESDSWSINSSDRPQSKTRRKTTGEGGVKGLGPLQLLNFAIKKGAIRDAVNESNAIEATHEQMEKEMEMTQGTADYHSIRKRIMKDKARQWAKPDFDEDTFETEAISNYTTVKHGSLIAPAGASVKIGRIYSTDNSEPTLTVLSPEGEETLTSPELDKEFQEFLAERKRHMSKKERIKFAYDQFKTYIKEYAKLLAIFIGMFARGMIESLISYLMRLSRDYRYIAYILQEEKRIHKELFTMDVDEHVSKVTRHQQRAMIREKLQEKYDKSGFLNDEGIRKLHQYVEETEEREDSEAFDAPLPEIVTEVIKEELEAEKAAEEAAEAIVETVVEEEKDNMSGKKQSIASKISKDSILSKDSSKASSKISIESKEIAVIQPAIIVQHDSEDDTTKVVHVPQVIIEVPRGSSTPSQMELRKLVDEAERALSPPIKKPKKEEYLLVRLIIAFYYAVLSRSELICYIMIIVNHIHSASFLSMPLPFMMLLWGTLTVPLPTKSFWITVISYTEGMVILKYVFQFGFFPWNSSAPSLDPFWLPRILGIEKTPNYAIWDLMLLMTLFLHRNILMATGLWRNTKKTKIGENGEEENSSDESEKDEPIPPSGSKASIASLQPPSNLLKEHRGSLFSRRRLTQISFTSMTKKFKKERIKRKWVSFNGFENKLTETTPNTNTFSPNKQPSSNPTHHVRFSVVNDFDVIVRLPSLSSSSNSVEHKVTRVQGFFGILLHPVNRVPIDMYAPMFLCDIICFMIVIFGYSSFGTDQGGGSVAAYFEENKVPGTLVAMLIIQFVLIVTDRALFLRKFLFGKLCFQLLLVIFIHIWIFFLLPAATDRLFVNNFTCKLWYFVKSIYFLISAKQIRCGYPKFSVGNVLTRNYNYLNYALKNCYMKVPFLYELGVLTDWIWKDTSLNLGDWITLHDIYQNIARLKCIRKWEEDFPSPKGVKQRPFIKYGYGGILLVLIILIIWFPLVLFSMANTVGTRSTPVMCTCRLSIAGYQPLFDSTAQLGDIQPLSPMEYENLYYKYRTSKTALSYIADYTNLDVVKATINGNSASQWQISPPAREYLMFNLNGSNPMSMQFEWNFKSENPKIYRFFFRAPDENLQYGVVEDFRVVELPPGDKIRQDLIAMIDGNSTTPILIPDLFPSMVKVPGEGKSEHVEALLREHLKGSRVPIETAYADVMLELVSVNGVEYWKLKMIDAMFDPVRKSDPIIRDDLVFYGFVDKVFPKSFSFITGGGILGLYISIVFLLGQYIRGFVVDSMQMIMFEELPNVDKILDLCHKIFFVRDVSRFDLEEALYANLVFIFRSPATLIRWTKERPV